MTVHVYFVSQVYRVFIRSLLTNFISLIANLGGVYSLLIGMSVLSAFELIYFFSVRLYLNYRDTKNDVQKPKTFSQRSDNVNISTLKVPRLDTAKSMVSDISSFRSSAYSHYWTKQPEFECNLCLPSTHLQNISNRCCVWLLSGIHVSFWKRQRISSHQGRKCFLIISTGFKCNLINSLICCWFCVWRKQK